jgi:hypothetical protein
MEKMNNAKQYFPWFLLVVLCATFPVIGKTIDDLRRSMIAIIRTQPSITGPYKGEERLPPQAFAAIQLLRKNGSSEYAVSDRVRNTYDYQRITEGAWPIRLLPSAPTTLFLASEPLDEACVKKGQQDGMVLARCR